jgi:AcrR family transcriptional regulator
MDATAPRGRRPHIAAAELARVAVTLFEAQGYDDTSMDEIAAVAHVSRRSLFRYFPTKATLVWHGFGPYLVTLTDLIEGVPEDAEPFGAVRDALLAALPESPADIASMRVQLGIIDSHPDLWSIGSQSLVVARDIIHRFLARRTELEPLHLVVLAETIITTTFTALRFWATTDNSSAESVVRSAFLALSGWGTPTSAPQFRSE